MDPLILRRVHNDSLRRFAHMPLPPALSADCDLKFVPSAEDAAFQASVKAECGELLRARSCYKRRRLDPTDQKPRTSFRVVGSCLDSLAAWYSFGLQPGSLEEGLLTKGIQGPLSAEPQQRHLPKQFPNFSSAYFCTAHADAKGTPFEPGCAACGRRVEFVDNELRQDLASGTVYRWDDRFKALKDIFGRDASSLSAKERFYLNRDLPLQSAPRGVVPKKGAEGRQTFDGRKANETQEHIPVSLEKVSDWAHLVDTTASPRMASFDLESAYSHLPLAVWFWSLHGFKWRGITYFFPSLPFGDSIAVALFEKLQVILRTYLRKRRVRLFGYIDDGGIHRAEHLIRADARLVATTYTKAGWSINWRKSFFWPKQVGVICGLLVDLKHFNIRISNRRRRDIFLQGQLIVSTFLGHRKVDAVLVAQFMGRLASCWVVLSHQLRLRMRRTWAGLHAALDIPADASLFQIKAAWGISYRLSRKAVEEIVMLARWIRTDPAVLLFPPSPSIHEFTIAQDTSETQYGGSVFVPGGQRINGPLPPCLLGTGSLVRELFGVFMVMYLLLRHGHISASSHILFCVDAQGITFVAESGSSVPLVQCLAAAILYLRGFVASCRFMWFPRSNKMLVLCDDLSKISRCSTELAWDILYHIQDLWGRFTIDRAADLRSCKIFDAFGRPSFNSEFLTPGSAGAPLELQTDWALHFNYVFPPFSMISVVVGLLRRFRARGVIVAPAASGEIWSPTLHHGSRGVVDVFRIPWRHGSVLRDGRPASTPRPICAILFDGDI